MQMVKKITMYLLLTWLALIIFMPKDELYFAVEQLLAKQGIKVNETAISGGPFRLDIHGITVYAHGIKVATVQDSQCFTLLFYTHIVLRHIKTDTAFKSMLPIQAEEVVLTHSVVSPFRIGLKAKGNFGEATGSIDLAERKIHINFAQIKKLGMLRSQLKKGKEGWYYESQY